MKRQRFLPWALATMLAACATNGPATLPGPLAAIPVFASDDERVGTAGFVGQTLRLKHEHEGVTYTLMAFVVGETLTLGAMVKGAFAGNVQWQVGGRKLSFPFDSAKVRAATPVHVSDSPEALLEGQSASFRGTSWLNVDVPLASFVDDGTALQLVFQSNTGNTVTLPDDGHHYVVQLTPRK
tara:strand:+ start:234 stop:779 length:546 start_codon:yes stop_codon:yes gene_type:complete